MCGGKTPVLFLISVWKETVFALKAVFGLNSSNQTGKVTLQINRI